MLQKTIKMQNVFICILNLKIHTQFVFIDILSIFFILYFVSSYQLKKENFHFHLCKPTNTNYANCYFFKNFEKSLHITIIGYIVFCQVIKLQCGFSFSKLKKIRYMFIHFDLVSFAFFPELSY